MEKHTPGPWMVRRFSNGTTEMPVAIEAVRPNDCLVIARAERQDGEEQANARLIAAAPDLLAALTRIEDQLVTLIAIRELTGEGLIMADGLINLARASIHQGRLEV